MRIAVALFDDAEELDWAGPWEVLAFWARMCPGDGVEVVTVAADAGPVRCANGLRVLADVTWDELGPVDGRAATTHWADVDALATHGQNVEVRADDRIIDAGEVITAPPV